jgi:CHAT domain-containing protein
LGNLLFSEGRWTEAHTAYTTAIQAAEALYAAAFMEAGREAEISENATLYIHAAFCLSHLGRFAEALARLEEGKTRTLAERLGRDAAQLQKAKPADQAAYREQLGRLRALEAEQRLGSDGRGLVVSSRSYTEIARDVEQVREKLNAITRRIRDYLPDFLPAPLDFTAIQALVTDEDAALVEFCVTEKESVVLVVQSAGEPEAVWIEGFTRNDLDGLIRDWIKAYFSQDDVYWQATIERVLNEIALRLIIPLHTMLQYDVTRLILMPQGSLFLLPLHAVPIGEEGVCVLDHYEVVYTPSATVLQRCGERVARARTQGLFAAANPTGDLYYTESEIQAIVPLFEEDTTVLWHEDATKEKILTNVKGCGYVHFSCHGQYDWETPSRSALYLAGSLPQDSKGQPGINLECALTLAEIEAKLDLTQTRLVTLSACETGLSEALGPQAEEYIGLPAGFLLAGAPAVVASLWAVDDLSTALLMGRFYRYHLQGDLDGADEGPLPPADALRRAQQWLRDKVTAKMVAEVWQQRAEALSAQGDPTCLHALNEQIRYELMGPNVYPFEHPWFWAPFTISGQ